jgi:hypothetical protein
MVASPAIPQVSHDLPIPVVHLGAPVAVGAPQAPNPWELAECRGILQSGGGPPYLKIDSKHPVMEDHERADEVRRDGPLRFIVFSQAWWRQVDVNRRDQDDWQENRGFLLAVVHAPNC